jgi:hypothetical protein
MAFKEGDVVVWEKKPDENWTVVHQLDSESIYIVRHERGGFVSIRVPISEIKPFNQYNMVKQAVREVLLSDEFLTAFAAAWVKTPLIHKSEMNLTIDPITGTESEAYYLDKLKKGEAK